MKPLRQLASKYLVPRSLRTRVAFLVLGAVLFSHTVTMVMINRYQERYVDPLKLDLTVTAVRTLRAALAYVPPEQRAATIQRSSHGQWHLWDQPLPPDALLHGDGAAIAGADEGAPDQLRQFVAHMNSRLGGDTVMAATHGRTARLYLSLSPRSQGPEVRQEWLVVPLDFLDPPLAAHIIAIWLLSLSGVLLLAGWFSWHISRPMTRLAEAADQLAAGTPSRVEPSGPNETRIVGERFNAMLDALSESEAVCRTLLAGLPHDLKGPLSRMWLRIEMSNDTALCEGMRKDLQDMQHMVEQFLGFVRGNDPKAYHYSPVSINDWLRDYTDHWRSSGLDISLRDESTDPNTLRLDAPALGRLLDNIVGNTLHHGQPPVVITLAVADGWVHLMVDDHGQGIAPERRAEALRPFLRLDDARTRTGNVGLGLALADAITRAHQGTLRLESAPGGGLRVCISIPLAGRDG